MARQAFIRMMILNYLLQNGELTGYGFIKFCRGSGVPASPGNVYPHLKELEDQRIIAFHVEGKKKIYALTERGHQEVADIGVSRVPEFLRNVFFRNISLASSIDWSKADEVAKLLNSVSEAKEFLEAYVEKLKAGP